MDLEVEPSITSPILIPEIEWNLTTSVIGALSLLSIVINPEIVSPLANSDFYSSAVIFTKSLYFETEALKLDESKTPGNSVVWYLITAASGALKLGLVNVTINGSYL